MLLRKRKNQYLFDIFLQILFFSKTLNSKTVLSFIFLFHIFFIANVFAENQKTVQHPIHIQADKMVANPIENNIFFQGNVKVKQDSMTLTASNVSVYINKSNKKNSFSRESIKKIDAKGNVKIKWDDYRVESEDATYIAKENKLILSGNKAYLYQGENRITGSKITLHMDNNQIEIESKKGEQVEAFYEYSEQDVKRFRDQKKK